MSIKLGEIHMAMLLTYIEDETDNIPLEISEQIKLKTNIDLGKNQIEIYELIGWRSTQQWQYFLNEVGIETDLGLVCRRKITSFNS